MSGGGSACHRVSGLLSHLAGEAQLFLFHFFAYRHGRRHIRKFAAAATFAKFSIDFSSIFSASVSLPQSERGGGKGKGRKDISFFFFSHNSKGRQAGKEGGREVYAISGRREKEIPLLLQFSNIFFFFPRSVSRSQVGKRRGGKYHSLTAVDSEEDWKDELEEGRKRKEKKRREKEKGARNTPSLTA